jgi:hypothetical protein
MCPAVKDEDLTLLASGELNPARSRQVRRHIAACEECGAAFTELQRLWQTAAATSRHAPDEMLYERIRQQIHAVPQAAGRTDRRAKIGRRLVISGLALAALSGAAVFIRTPGTERRSSGIAFAQVEAAMGKIHTVTWRDNVTVLAGNERTFKDNVDLATCWARTKSPALARIRRKGSRTVQFSAETYQIYEWEWGRNYSRREGGIFVPEVFGPQKPDSPLERLQSAILFSRGDSKDEDWTATGRVTTTKIHSTPWVSTDTVLDGKPLLRFDRSLTYSYGPQQKVSLGKIERSTWSYWVEPQTYRIVRREVLTRQTGVGRPFEARFISDQFRYNLAPPIGVFEVVPPLGTKYSFTNLPERRSTQEEQTQIVVAIKRAIDAWNRRDSSAFAAAWDFDYDVIPKRQSIRRKSNLLRSAVTILERSATLLSVSRARSRNASVFIRRTSSDPFPPKESTEFSAVVATQVVAPNGSTKERPLLLNLSRQKDGSFKIIRWYVMRLNPGNREKA